MSRFLDRYLPCEERRTAAWLALGGVSVLIARSLVARIPAQVFLRRLQSLENAPQWAGYALWAVDFLSIAVVTALVVWACLRFGRAPRALVLYLVVAGLAGTAVGVIALPFAASAGASMDPLSLVFGFAGSLAGPAGAMAAGAVDARARRSGADRITLSAATGAADGLGALGTRVALAFAVVTIAPEIVLGLQSGFMTLAAGRAAAAGREFIGLGVAFQFGFYAARGLAWAASGALVTKVYRVRSAWLAPASGALSIVAVSVPYLFSDGLKPFLQGVGNAVLALVWGALTLVGVMVALGHGTDLGAEEKAQHSQP